MANMNKKVLVKGKLYLNKPVMSCNIYLQRLQKRICYRNGSRFIIIHTKTKYNN